jgi:hypothetical protein
MMDQEMGYVRYLYERHHGRIAIGVGYDMNLDEIYPLVYESPKGHALGIVALSAVQGEGGPIVYIFHFSTFNPGKGNGGLILDDLCRLADHYQVVLGLSPFTLPNGNKDVMNSRQLRAWYATYGFEGASAFNRAPLPPLSPLSA